MLKASLIMPIINRGLRPPTGARTTAACPLTRPKSRHASEEISNYTHVAVLLILVVLVLLSACKGVPAGGGSGVGSQHASVILQPDLRSHRVTTTVIGCGDTNIGYDSRLYRVGNQLVADMLDAAVEPNTDPLVAYLTLLNSDPYAPASTPLVIRIPAIPAQPQPPTLLPTPRPSSNPYADAQARQQVERANAATLRDYQQRLSALDGALAEVRQQVHQQTNRLRALNPARATTPSSVFGCLALASDRLAGVSGGKWLVIWSDLRNTSWTDYLPPSQLALQGVHVRVLYLPCLSAAQCRCLKAFWNRVFQQAGTSDIQYFDVAQSATLSSFFTLGSQGTP